MFAELSPASREAIDACRRHIAAAGAFSLALNLLHLAAPLYMMQVYDRVLSSGSGTTLALLTVIVLAAYVSLAGLDRARAHVLVAASSRIDRLFARRVFVGMFDPACSQTQQALRDFDTCRHFISGSGMTTLMDVPWVPMFVAIAFILHSAIGWFTLLSALTLVSLAVASERLLRSRVSDAHSASATTHAMAEMGLLNAGSVRAMGMAPALGSRWWQMRRDATTCQRLVSSRTADLAAMAKLLRLTMQSLVLGLGAWLVIEKALSPGAIFAGSLILGRALQPVEQVIAQWRSMLAAREALTRIEALLGSGPSPRVAAQQDARVRCVLKAEGVAVAADNRAILARSSFTIEAGESVAVIGPSGAGKSTLVRVLAGAVRPSVGHVRWGTEDHLSGNRETNHNIGYLGQDPELFDDTVAANISRFHPTDVDGVLRAADIAGAHDLIMGLPNGYLTRIGPGGSALSGGMKRRIALARAVYGDPDVVILDEPGANLDRAGDAELEKCIRALQKRGTTLIVVSHRPVTIALMTKVLVIIGGRVSAYGTREDVVRALSSRMPAAIGMPPGRTSEARAMP